MLLWGIVLLIFGGTFLIGSLMGKNVSFFFDGWWTVFLIVPAIASMVQNRVDIGNTIILLLGVILLARAQGWIVIRALADGRSSRSHSWTQDAESNPSHTAVLSSRRIKSSPVRLSGATCTAALGGIIVDLSDCRVEEDITVFCNAILGSVQVIAPKNVKVAYRNLPILGNVSGKTTGNSLENNIPTVTFDCTAVLGAVTVS